MAAEYRRPVEVADRLGWLAQLAGALAADKSGSFTQAFQSVTFSDSDHDVRTDRGLAMVEVRRATVEDVEAAADAYEAAWDAAHAQQIGTRLGELISYAELVKAFHDALSKAGDSAQILVSEAEGRITGLALVVSTGDGTGEPTHLYVRPDRWGHGDGTALHSSSLEEFGAMEATSLVLWVGESNERARSFYARAGWAPDGETRASPLSPVEVRFRRSNG